VIFPFKLPARYEFTGEGRAATARALGGVWLGSWPPTARLAAAIREAPPASSTPMPSFATTGLPLPAEVVQILDRTLNKIPRVSPSMEEVTAVLERYLLYGRDRAYISYGSQSRMLNTPGETINSRQECIRSPSRTMACGFGSQ
jgi:hypothetical protein